MSLFQMGVAGLGEGVKNLSNKFIDEELVQQRAAALAELKQRFDLDTESKLHKQQNAPERLEAGRQARTADTLSAERAKRAAEAEGVNDPLYVEALRQKALEAGRVARATEIEKLNDPHLRDAIKSNAEFKRPITAADTESDTAAKARGTGVTLSPGQQYSIGGAPIAENTRITAPEVYERGLHPPGSGRGSGRADHYDDKDWDAAGKPTTDQISFGGDLGGKPVDSPVLRQVFQEKFTQLRDSGQIRPDQAAVIAGAQLLRLRELAEARVAEARRLDRKSELTEEQAAKDILREAREAAKKAQQDSAAAGGPPAAGGAVTRVPNPMATTAVADQEARYVPAAGKRPLAEVAREKAAADDPLEAAGRQLDAARVKFAAASEAVQRFGQRQITADPQAYRAAQAARAAAQQARDQAEQAYRVLAAQAVPGAAFARTAQGD